MTRARGLAGFASAISGPVNSTDLNVGVLTATNVTVGGTITYEDVSNVDSVGIITAQAGIRVTGGSVGIGTNDPTGKLEIAGNNSSQIIKYGDGTKAGYFISRTDVNRSNAEAAIHIHDFRWNGTSVARIKGLTGDDTTNKDNGHLTFETSSGASVSERMRIAADGNVGIGSIIPSRQLTVDSGGSSATGGILVKNGLYGSNQNATYLIAASKNFTGGTANWGSYGFQHKLKSNSGGTGRVTIDGYYGELFSVNNAGHVAIGTDSAGARLHVHRDVDTAYANSCILSRGADSNFQFLVTNGSNSNSSGQPVTRFGMHYNGVGWDQYFSFERGAGAQAGNMTYYTQGAARDPFKIYNTGYIGCPDRLAGSGTVGVSCNSAGTLIRSTSDGTLKENVTPIGSQYEVVKALNPVTYTWIDTDFMGDQTELGFIAQEVQPHIPEVVSVDNDGKFGLDYQKLTATLTKALQEAIAKIETLETKVAALEGN